MHFEEKTTTLDNNQYLFVYIFSHLPMPSISAFQNYGVVT